MMYAIFLGSVFLGSIIGAFAPWILVYGEYEDQYDLGLKNTDNGFGPWLLDNKMQLFICIVVTVVCLAPLVIH